VFYKRVGFQYGELVVHYERAVVHYKRAVVHYKRVVVQYERVIVHYGSIIEAKKLKKNLNSLFSTACSKQA